ncbi:hypothetical protein MAP00_007748 [Monascus purpureus]|nr:hypothetical protein MAP00_007748 [Monascus purpureus]
MPPTIQPFMADEELGKKNDDHRPRQRPLRRPSWRTPRPRRLLLAVVGLYLLYLFFKNMPTDLTPAPERYNPELARARQKGQTPPSNPSPGVPPQDAPPRDETVKDIDKNKDGDYYDGDISLSHLMASLGRLPKPGPEGPLFSRAVVFAGSNLASISDLIPLACQMAVRKKNIVHFVIMGRDEVSIEGIRQVNAVNNDNCPVLWHDGRPDNAPLSRDSRMESAVIAGLSRVQFATYPRAVITQGAGLEDSFFWNGVTRWAHDAGVAHVALPTMSRNIMWMSTLDSTALGAWNEVNIEMLIHAPSESSGSLIRLIQSLEKADYLGSVPSLTIELPSHVDPQLLRFLQGMKWPPRSSSKITLRRRVQPYDITSAESSVRTVEAFYPKDPSMSHVLVLSPQVEVAPSFYHYLKFTMLNYKQTFPLEQGSSNLLGISLELPSSKPAAGDEHFDPPLPMSFGDDLVKKDKEALPHFLWQAPNSNAALYFGDKWVEFHSFLSNRLAIQEANPNVPSHEKLLSRRYPAFMEYLLELMRARGYYMLYPSFAARGTFSLVTVHNDLYRPPEEFSYDTSLMTEEKLKRDLDELLKDSNRQPIGDLGFIKKPLNPALTLTAFTDQFSTALPPLNTLDLLSFSGEKSSIKDYRQDTKEYLKKFRVNFGGCHDTASGIDTDSPEHQDLFCLGL